MVGRHGLGRGHNDLDHYGHDAKIHQNHSAHRSYERPNKAVFDREPAAEITIKYSFAYDLTTAVEKKLKTRVRNMIMDELKVFDGRK